MNLVRTVPSAHRRSQGRGAKGAMPPQIFRKYSHFVLWFERLLILHKKITFEIIYKALLKSRNRVGEGGAQ